MELIVLLVLPLALATLPLAFPRPPKRALRRALTHVVLPLSVLGLIGVPNDLPTAVPWLVAGLCFLGSIVSLVRLTAGPAIDRFWRKTESNFDSALLLRPGVFAAAFLCATRIVGMSVTAANAYALGLAVETQAAVATTGTCQINPHAWPAAQTGALESVDYQTWHGGFGTKYPVRYRCDAASGQFAYHVRININESFEVRGSPGEPLHVRYGHCNAPTEVVLGDATDLNRLAARGY